MFIDTYNYARRLKTLMGLTPAQFIWKEWQARPELFYQEPCYLTSGLYIWTAQRRHLFAINRVKRARSHCHSVILTTTFVSIGRAFAVVQLERSVELPVNSTVSPMIWVQPLVVLEFPLKLIAEVGT